MLTTYDSSGSVSDADLKICFEAFASKTIKKEEQKMSKEIRVMYLRDRKGQPQGCVACQVKRSGNSYVGNYQLSVLNPSDKFNRGVARALAKGRLVENPHTVQLPTVPSMHEVTERIMLAILLDKTMPTRARKSAQLWLDKKEQTFDF